MHSVGKAGSLDQLLTNMGFLELNPITNIPCDSEKLFIVDTLDGRNIHDVLSSGLRSQLLQAQGVEDVRDLPRLRQVRGLVPRRVLQEQGQPF